jgi:16S rRNA (cytosine967-C5)-methyltransferase
LRVTVTAARRGAFEILRRVATEEAYASNLLAATRDESLSREDRALLQELTLGALRWQARLDFLIEHYARRKLGKLDAAVVIALRLGLYQLRFLTRIPPHAAINESVNLVKAQGLRSAAPLVNAVLRAAQRASQADEAELIAALIDPRARLSLETSHPAWLLDRWTARFGADEARALALANNTAPRVSFRFNPRRASAERTRAWLSAHSITIRDSALAPQAAIIESGSLTADAEPVREGWIYLQDEASQLVAHLAVNEGGRRQAKCGVKDGDSSVNPQSPIPHPPSNIPPSAFRLPPSQALDLCAAPGSKTTLLASLLPPGALVIAGDLHHHRLRTMRELAARLDAAGIHPLQLDAAGALPFATPGAFDVVLVDAPCSGLGTLQRHPEIKWRMTAAKIPELAALQRQLLTNAARQVRVGGLLTYAVCSTEPEEGEEVIASFRRAHPEYRDLTRERLTELGLDPAALLTAAHGARTFTHRHGTESFFVCVLWKRR